MGTFIGHLYSIDILVQSYKERFGKSLGRLYYTLVLACLVVPIFLFVNWSLSYANLHTLHKAFLTSLSTLLSCLNRTGVARQELHSQRLVQAHSYSHILGSVRVLKDGTIPRT